MLKRSGAAQQRGSMLIIAMGVLTLICLMAVTFFTLMTLERKVATAYVDRVRSVMLAQAGIETVVGKIKESEGYRVFSDPDSPLVYNRGKDGEPDWNTPIEHVKKGRTSLEQDLGGSKIDGLDGFRVKLVDANAMININDQHPTLKYMLEGLGLVIAKIHDVENPIPRGAGEKIINVRNRVYGGKFTSKIQLREVVGEKNYPLIRNLVTIGSWVDKTAVMPSFDTINNPSAAIARGKVQYVHPEDISPIQAELLQLGGRAPINVNEAPIEVLAAAIMPIGGRRAFHPVPNMPAPVPIDQGQNYQAKGNLGGFLEETDFSSLYFSKPNTGKWLPYQWVFFKPYWRQANGVERAIALARRIIRERTGQTYSAGRPRGPFQSVWDFDRWVDSLPNGPEIFISPSETDIPTERQLARWGPIRGHADYRRFHYESVKSMIKANFNPNALVNSFNPSSAAWRPLDKANLLYPTDEQLNKINFTTGGQSGSVGDFISCQSVDFCFGPMGYYEITSLGEVTGAQDEDLPPERNRPVYGMAKQRALVQVMGVIRHTSQTDFERNDNIYNNSNRARQNVRTVPENDVLWPPGDGSGRNSLGHGGGAIKEYGHIELDSSVSRGVAPRDRPNLAPGGGGGTRPNPLFKVLFDSRPDAYKGGDFKLWHGFFADRAGGQPGTNTGLSQPYGSAVSGDHDTHPQAVSSANFVRAGGVHYVDGFYSSLAMEGKGTTGDAKTLWYRVSDPGVQNPKAQGESQPKGQVNLEAFEGAIEFWYKPDFDWSSWDEKNRAPIESNPIFCGLLQTTHIMQNPDIDQSLSKNTGVPTRAIQMFVFRNTSGDIRVVRLYSEVIGQEDGDEQPWLPNPNIQDASNKNLELRVHEYIKENKDGIKDFDWPPNLTPPGGLKILQHETGEVTYAREDFVVPYDELKFWRAHEWHHIAIVWDDSGGGVATDDPSSYCAIFIDGKPISMSQRINYRLVGKKDDSGSDAGEFVRLNHEPIPREVRNDPIAKDSMYVGCIHRPQAVAGGIFKFDKVVTFGANGTIDDVRTYKESLKDRLEVARPTDRFVAGTYEQRFEIPFPGNVRRIRLGTLSFTAYMPQEYKDADPNKIGGARVEVTLLRNGRPIDRIGGGWVFQENRPTGGFPITHNLEQDGDPIFLEKGETLTYRVRLTPGRNALGYTATPVLDDVTLTYFLPKVKILYQEEVLD